MLQQQQGSSPGTGARTGHVASVGAFVTGEGEHLIRGAIGRGAPSYGGDGVRLRRELSGHDGGRCLGGRQLPIVRAQRSAAAAHGGADSWWRNRSRQPQTTGAAEARTGVRGSRLRGGAGVRLGNPAPVETIATPTGRGARICRNYPYLVCGSAIGTTCGAVSRFDPLGH